MPYQEIQALGFPNSPRKLGLYEKPWACISWYGPCTQLVNSKYCIVLYCIVLHCTALQCTALHCTALYCTALHCTALHCTVLHCTALLSLTKVLHCKPMAYYGKFAVKRTAKSTLANYGKLSRAKHRGKKRSPASHKRMANNGIFTFPGVKASHGLLRYFSLQINLKKKTTNLPLFARRC